MDILYLNFILLWLSLSTMENVSGQNAESIRIPSAGDSCNVINLNIGREEDSGQQARGPRGPQGKRGSVGLPGLKGSKGQKGEVGPRGLTPEINIVETTSAVLKALTATSCKELSEDHGISQSGYYQMKTNETDFPTYKYCDFQVYEVSTCKELKTRLGENMKPGFYLLQNESFIFCRNLRYPDCQHVVRSEAKISLPFGGVFDVYSKSWPQKIEVLCDLETDGGGWTVFQRRMDGSVDFYRSWMDYVNGFGDKTGEFWLGLEAIYQLTKDGNYELRVDITDWFGNSAYTKYGTFSVSSRDDNYRLRAEDYSGDAGDSLIQHNNYQFSTKDADHDTSSNLNCAQRYKGGWWFASCLGSDLNGLYNKGHGSGATGVTWYYWKNNYHYLKATEMKFRKKE